MSYRAVDRSDFTPNFDGRMGDEVYDIGWAEGVLHDGRPYRMECWGLAGSTGVTVFMASAGLEGCAAAQIDALLEASGVITAFETQELSLHHFVDCAGTPCLSISYIVADADDEEYAEAHPPLMGYRNTGDGAEPYVPIDEQALADFIDTLLTPEPHTRSALAEARRAAKAAARALPNRGKKKRIKRRNFRKN